MAVTEQVLIDACKEFIADFLDAYHKDNDEVAYRVKETLHPSRQETAQKEPTDDNNNDGDHDTPNTSLTSTDTGCNEAVNCSRFCGTTAAAPVGCYAHRFGADGSGRSRRLCLLTPDVRAAIRERFNRYRSASAPFYDEIYRYRHEATCKNSQNSDGNNKGSPRGIVPCPQRRIEPQLDSIDSAFYQHRRHRRHRRDPTADDSCDTGSTRLEGNIGADKGGSGGASHPAPRPQRSRPFQHFVPQSDDNETDEAITDNNHGHCQEHHQRRPAWVLPIGYYDATIDRFVYAVRCPAHFIADFAMRVVLLSHLMVQSSAREQSEEPPPLNAKPFSTWVHALQSRLDQLKNTHEAIFGSITQQRSDANRTNNQSGHAAKSVFGALPLDYTTNAFRLGLRWCDEVLWPALQSSGAVQNTEKSEFECVSINERAYVIRTDYEQQSNARGDDYPQLANIVVLASKVIRLSVSKKPDQLYCLDRGPVFGWNGCLSNRNASRWNSRKTPAFVRWLAGVSKWSPLPQSVPKLLWSALVVAFGASSHHCRHLAAQVGMPHEVAIRDRKMLVQNEHFWSAESIADRKQMVGTAVVMCGDVTMSFSDLFLSQTGTIAALGPSAHPPAAGDADSSLPTPIASPALGPSAHPPAAIARGGRGDGNDAQSLFNYNDNDSLPSEEAAANLQDTETSSGDTVIRAQKRRGRSSSFDADRQTLHCGQRTEDRIFPTSTTDTSVSGTGCDSIPPSPLLAATSYRRDCSIPEDNAAIMRSPLAEQTRSVGWGSTPGVHTCTAPSPAAPLPLALVSSQAGASLFESVSYTISGAYPRHMVAFNPRIGDQHLRVALSSPSVQDADADIVVASFVSTRVPVALTWWLAYGPQRIVLNLDQMYVDGLATTYQISDTSFILTFRPGTLVAGWDYAVCLGASTASGTSVSAEATFSVLQTFREQLRHFFVAEVFDYVTPDPAMPEDAFRALVKDVEWAVALVHPPYQPLTEDIKRDIGHRISIGMLPPTDTTNGGHVAGPLRRIRPPPHAHSAEI